MNKTIGFNKAVNDFIAWNLRKEYQKSISEEEFNTLLEKRKEEISSNLEKFKNIVNKFPVGVSGNPFIPAFLMVMFPSLTDGLDKALDNLVGGELSLEERNEYTNIYLRKSKIGSIITFLENNENLKDSNGISPIVKDLLELKNILIPLFKTAEKELQEKLDKYGRH